jgi:hypothetical protein
MTNCWAVVSKASAITGRAEGRELQWVWHVACIGETRYAYVILPENFLGGWKGNGMIILRWMSGK